MPKKKGKITKEIGAIPEKHELLTVDIFALAGFDVNTTPYIVRLISRRTLLLIYAVSR